MGEDKPFNKLKKQFKRMNKYIIILFLTLISCKEEPKKVNKNEKNKLKITQTSDYSLIKTQNSKGLLILFPCFPCDSKNTLSEFKIKEISVKNGISILAMNLNKLLYLKQTEKQELAEKLSKIIQENNLSKENIFIGGFSSGGNVSLLISDYLVRNKSLIKPKGVFIVDSPIDLLALYKTSKKNLKRNFSEVSVQESKWIVKMLENEFGNPKNGISKYEKNAPYTSESKNIDNLKGLEKLKIRLYTEPDLEWWGKQRRNNLEDLNAYYIQDLSKKLEIEFGSNNIELINTQNRGYRANGERHPHSWSIVDEKDLISWILE